MTPARPSAPGRLAAVLDRGTTLDAGSLVDPWAPAAVPDDGPSPPAGPWAGPADADGGDPPTVPLPVVALPVVASPTAGPPGPVPAAARRRAARTVARWLPVSWRRARLDPGRPGTLALLLVAGLAAVLAAAGTWWQVPRPEPVPALPALVDTASASSGAPSPAPAAAGPAAELVVAVSGRVRRPGLVRVPAGARVADVLEAAGGVLPGTDLGRVNLARRVSDGEQVAVAVPPAADAAPAGATGPDPTASGPGAAPGAPVDLNTAGVTQLEALPGVGPVTAQRIVEWRTRHGRFTAVEQLREVEGIGERRFGQLRALVRV